jgi:hypothetical protein
MWLCAAKEGRVRKILLQFIKMLLCYSLDYSWKYTCSMLQLTSLDVKEGTCHKCSAILNGTKRPAFPESGKWSTETQLQHSLMNRRLIS